MARQERSQEGSTDYLSLDGIVSNETRAWDGAKEALPPGDYNVEITEYEKGQSSKENPQVVVRFKVMDGEHAGQTIRQWYTLTSKAVGRFLNLLQACGLALDEKKGLPLKQLTGQKLAISVFDDMIEGDENPVTGEKTMKKFSKVFKERAYTRNGTAAARPPGQAEAR